jgi:hypothetical protein
MYAGLIVLISSFFAAEIRPRWMRIALFILSAAALAGNWARPVDFAKEFILQVIMLGVIVFGVRRVMRFNLLGCFLVVAGTSLLGGGLELLTQPDAFYRTNGIAVLLALALLLAWPLMAWRTRPAGHAAE